MIVSVGICRGTSGRSVQLSYIMLPMLSRCSLFRRIGATSLPLILLWTFVACLALCSDHTAEAGEDGAHRTAHSISESCDDENCPIPSSSFLLPERQSNVSAQPGTSAVDVNFTTCASLNSDLPRSLTRLSPLSSTSDPPRKRLDILRI